MSINLIYKRFWERLVSKPCQSSHPGVQVRSFIIVTHSRIVVLDNLNERSHDLGEENDTNQHEEDSYEHLIS